MSRAPSTFRQRDVTAVIKAAVAAGVEIGKIEVAPDGTIVVSAKSEEDVPRPNEWEGARL